MNVHVVTDPRLGRPSEFPMKYFLLRADCSFSSNGNPSSLNLFLGDIFKNDSFVLRRNAFAVFFCHFLESPPRSCMFSQIK